MIDSKPLLITGGTGSFGQEFVKRALLYHKSKVIRVFSRGELLQNEMRKHFNDDSRLVFSIGGVHGRARLYNAI